MASDGSVTLDMSIDHGVLDKAISALNATLKKFAGDSVDNLSDIDDKMSELAKSAQKLKIEPTADGLKEAEQNLDHLNAVIDNQENTLANYREAYKKASEEHGQFSNQALKLQKTILNLEDQINKNIKKSDEYARVLGDVEDVLQEGGQAAQTFSKKMGYVYTAADKAGDASEDFSQQASEAAKTMGQAGKSAKELGNSFENVPESAGKAAEGTDLFKVSLGNLIAEGISKAISAIGDLLEKTQEYRKDMSLLNQNARDAGVSLEITSTAMRNLNAITGETDSNVEAVSNLLATGFNDNGLLEAVDALSGAVIKFPDTMKIESLADSLQETVATGEATGQFAELLGRLGVNVESYNKQIGRMTEAHRASYSIMVLNREGMSKLNDEYRKNNEALIATANAEYDLNEAMASFAAVVEPIKAKVLTQLAEILTENSDVIEGIINFIGGAIEMLLKVPAPVWAVIAVIGAAIGILSALGPVLLATSASAGAASTGLAALSPAAITAGVGLLPLTLNVLAVAAAIAVVIAAIAALIAAIAYLKKAWKGEDANFKINFDSSDVPSVDELVKQQGGKGYATGTASAAAGYAWVGENGPELVKFSGGEEVLTASQSMARRSMNRNRQVVYNYSTYNTFKVDDIRTYQQIEQRMKNERITRRMGYTGV